MQNHLIDSTLIFPCHLDRIQRVEAATINNLRLSHTETEQAVKLKFKHV